MHQLSLKALRQQAGRTQKEVAELCDVDVRVYRKWETNPADMPYGLHLQVTDFLERAVQIRKETKMSKDMGSVHVQFHVPEDDDYKDSSYTVDIPEGATEEFEPSQPVSMKQWAAWDRRGEEPYPGFAEELEKWDKANERLNRTQLAEDGAPVPELDTVQVDPEFDEMTGEPVTYDETQVVVDAETGEEDIFIDTADIDPDELAEHDAEQAGE